MFRNKVSISILTYLVCFLMFFVSCKKVVPNNTNGIDSQKSSFTISENSNTTSNSLFTSSSFSDSENNSSAIRSTVEPNVTSNIPKAAQISYYFEMPDAIMNSYKDVVALMAIQGIVNRDYPRLFIGDSINIYYKESSKKMKQAFENMGYVFTTLKSIEDVYKTFGKYFNGIIITSDLIKSHNGWMAADSDFTAFISSLTDYLPVSKENLVLAKSATGLKEATTFTLNGIEMQANMYESLKKNGIDRFSQQAGPKVYEFMANKFASLSNQEMLNNMVPDGIDFATKNKMLILDVQPNKSAIDSTTLTYLTNYFRTKNKVWKLFGWVDDETAGVIYMSMNGGAIKNTGIKNASFCAVARGVSNFKQVSKYTSNYNPDKTYITFSGSEYDTTRFVMSFQMGGWFDEFRGKVPINWGLIGDTIEYFPSIVKYYQNTASAKDYFISGGASAVGFVDYSSDMPHAQREHLILLNQKYLRLMDQKYLDLYQIYNFTSDKVALLANYLKSSGAKGAVVGMRGKHQNGALIKNDFFFLNRDGYYNRGRDYSNEDNNNMSYKNFDYKSDSLWVQKSSDKESNYWMSVVGVKSINASRSGVELFRQSDGQAYRFYIKDGIAFISKGTLSNETILLSKNIGQKDQATIKVSAERSSSVDTSTTLRMYYADRVRNSKDDQPVNIYEYKYVGEITDGSYSKGRYALFSEDGRCNDTFKTVPGTKPLFGSNQPFSGPGVGFEGIRYSKAIQVVNRIKSNIKVVSGGAKFVVGYYGYIWNENHHLTQNISEPGPGDTMTISPKDLYKAMTILNEESPGKYEFVNLPELMDYAEKHYRQFGTLS